MKVGQRLKDDKLVSQFLYPNLSHPIGESPMQSECFEVFGRGIGKISQDGFSITDISRITSKPWLTILKRFAISMRSMIESGNSVGKKKTHCIHTLRAKFFPIV